MSEATYARRLLPLFELGGIIVTPGAAPRLNLLDVETVLARHAFGNWSDETGAASRISNEHAILNGGPIVACYQASGGKVKVHTDATRSLTTIMLPEED